MIITNEFPINPVLHVPQPEFISGAGGTKRKQIAKKSGADGTPSATTIEQIRNSKLTELINKLNSEGLKITTVYQYIQGYSNGKGIFTPAQAVFIQAGSLTDDDYINKKLAGKLISDQTVEIANMLSNVKQTAKDILAYRLTLGTTPASTPSGTGGTTGAVTVSGQSSASKKTIMGMTHTKAAFVGGGFLVVLVAGIIFVPKLFKKHSKVAA